MCGYIQRNPQSPVLAATMEQIGLGSLAAGLTSAVGVQHFYPAFGGNADRTIDGLILSKADTTQLVDATWWFDCQEEAGRLVVGGRTTFNARNLESPYWKGSVRHRRALVVATSIGESQADTEGKKRQYLMTGTDNALLLGAVYREFPSGQYACAVITRSPTQDFARFHEKAMPLFLPPNPEVINDWLNPEVLGTPIVDQLLHNGVSNTLEVAQVKSFKSGTVVSECGLIN